MPDLRQFNPRTRLAAAIGWSVFAVVTLAAWLAAHLASAEAERRARADAEVLLVELATQARDAVSMQMEARRALLQATAASVTAAEMAHPRLAQQALESVQVQFPEFSWLGAIDATGRVVAATGTVGEGADLSASALFQQGRRRMVANERHTPFPQPEGDASREARAPWRMELAVPLGGSGGVMAAHVSWAWVEGMLGRMQSALSTRRQTQLMLAGRHDEVLVGPPDWLGRVLDDRADLSEGGRYMVSSRKQVRLAAGLGLGWTAVVRQLAEPTLEPVRIARQSIFMMVFLAGLSAAAAGVIVTRLLTRRLSALAHDAEAVRQGNLQRLARPEGRDEVARIGRTLSQLVDHLQAEKSALQGLNAELDQRVVERTARIERMADEARQAAVTRERLRLARDMHDTLAHSLMALLTQVRLVRKLRTRMDPAELDAELGRAEAVAATGLSEARAAIRQMRDNGVQDTGLGAALSDLCWRFGQRTGLAVDAQLDAAPAAWADERAETVFRIVEESLRNIERHAQARRVTLTMRGRGPSTQLTVADDGRGFDPQAPAPGHYGLRGMHEQAQLIGAQLAVNSAPGDGTRVVLTLPA